MNLAQDNAMVLFLNSFENQAVEKSVYLNLIALISQVYGDTAAKAVEECFYFSDAEWSFFVKIDTFPGAALRQCLAKPVMHPTPWRVEYNPRNMDLWHPKSQPYIVDRDGKRIPVWISQSLSVMHPGHYDAEADTLAQRIVAAVNSNSAIP
jgi:hypothetical protein